MADSMEAIRNYLVQLAGYTVPEEQNEAFGTYLHAVQELYRSMDTLYRAGEDGKPEPIGPERLQALETRYQSVFEATRAYRELAAGQLSENPNAQARDGLTERFSALLMKDFNALSGTLNAEEKSLPEILSQARSLRVDLTGQELSGTGANLSSRIPLTFRDTTGRQVSGFFTETSVLDEKADLEGLYQKAVEGHPEFERAVKTILNSENINLIIMQSQDDVEKNIRNCLKQEDLAHAFDFLLLDAVNDRPEEERQETARYLESITGDNTFALRMAELYRNRARIRNKNMTLEYAAGIAQGSNLEQRNAAMCSL